MQLCTIPRRWYSYLTTFVVMVFTGVLPAGEAAAKTALLVVGNTALSASDSALQNRLNYYYTVTVRDDSASADTSKNLIVISASVDPARVGTKYKTATKGAVVLHPEICSMTWG
jgi:hypothetical protein